MGKDGKERKGKEVHAKKTGNKKPGNPEREEAKIDLRKTRNEGVGMDVPLFIVAADVGR